MSFIIVEDMWLSSELTSMKKNWPLVTVGLCVKNNEKTVGEAIKSIINTDYPRDKVEIVVVDGMSRDKTIEIVRVMFKNADFQWMPLCDKGRGLAYARQMVLESARGKYILWIDGDNVIPGHFIRRHVEFMEHNPNNGASSALVIPKGGTIVARLQGYQFFFSSSVEMRMKGSYRQSEVTILGMQGVACRAVAMKSVGGFDTHIVGAGEDVDLLIRMQFNGWKISVTPNTWIYHYMKSDWKSLLIESIWLGYGNHYLSHKYPKAIGPLVTKRTAFSLLVMVERTLKTAKLFKGYACFLMPLYYLYRRVGYLRGFRKAHKNEYGHNFA